MINIRYTNHTYDITPNIGTVFAPCGICGARYYRGPLHITDDDGTVLCLDCAAEYEGGLYKGLQEYYSNINESWMDAHRNERIIYHIIIGLVPGSACQYDEPFRCDCFFQVIAEKYELLMLHVYINKNGALRLQASSDGMAFKSFDHILTENEVIREGLVKFKEEIDKLRYCFIHVVDHQRLNLQPRLPTRAEYHDPSIIARAMKPKVIDVDEFTAMKQSA